MLYCPKCQKTYDNGGQRFCLNEGERLIPFAAAGKSANQTHGVFTSVLQRKTGKTPETLPPVQPSPLDAPAASPQFQSPAEYGVFKPESKTNFELDLPATEFKARFADATDSVVETKNDFSEVVENVRQAETSDREFVKAETPTEAESNAEAAAEASADDSINGTLKNRYRLVEQIGGDASGERFLARDEAAGEDVSVKIFDPASDAFAERVFSDERDRLRQLEHPNIAANLDGGATADGKSFAVTELIAGESIADVLARDGQFDLLRAARVVRQAAEALGAAHRANITHRNLTADNLVLTPDENGAERVKIVEFGAGESKLNYENLPYKSPEQIEGKNAVAASDIYSLGVVAYQMLTRRLPFDADTVGEMLKAQREAVRLRVSDVRFDAPPALDDILKKALAFYSYDRYLKATDFGDAFFSEIIANLPLEFDAEDEDEDVIEPANRKIAAAPFTPPATVESPTPIEKTPAIIIEKAELQAQAALETGAARATDSMPETVKAKDGAAWENRSSDLPKEANAGKNLLAFAGIAAILLVFLGVWYYFVNRPTETAAISANETVANQTSAPAADPLPTMNAPTNVNAAPPPEEIEAPPIPRQIAQPPNTSYFQNSKNALKGEAAKNYLGFSLYYPTDWTLNDAGNNFLDVSKKARNGLPIEQMLVSFYNSKGTFKADAAAVFSAQVVETNRTLKKILPNYRMVAEGKKIVNNGWQAYEVRFEGESKAGGETVKIYGKRLFIPTAIRGMKNGYVVTLLATSLQKEIKSVEDVGVKGELSTILETFEPNQNF